MSRCTEFQHHRPPGKAAGGFRLQSPKSKISWGSASASAGVGVTAGLDLGSGIWDLGLWVWALGDWLISDLDPHLGCLYLVPAAGALAGLPSSAISDHLPCRR
jgi:hypothetical protein